MRAPLGLAPGADHGVLMAGFSFVCFVLYAVDLAGQGSLRFVATEPANIDHTRLQCSSGLDGSWKDTQTIFSKWALTRLYNSCQ